MAKDKEDIGSIEEFIVLRGNVRVAEGFVSHPGVVHLGVNDAKRMDPTGATLKLKRVWDAEQKGAEAAKTATAAALAEHTEPEHKPATAAKGKHK